MDASIKYPLLTNQLDLTGSGCHRCIVALSQPEVVATVALERCLRIVVLTGVDGKVEKASNKNRLLQLSDIVAFASR